ncbi:MAG TPA: hypothetical protein PKE06_25710 [Flavilitoribacter sp.]|nr:hypothetical protein [Flavilitoribacter sp.]HMQ91304.1 hypothetical protein [Flavilitoribacter sp.]
MKEPIFTAQPIQSADQWSFWIAAAVAVMALLAMWKTLNGGFGLERNRAKVISMLLFFAFMIAASTAFFSFWSMRKTGPVRIYADAIETPYGKVAFEDIADARIETIRRPSLVDPAQNRGKNVKALVIEERNRKIHYLSEKNYNINEIMSRLKAAVDAD